ncbi:MAG: PqqD family peptide modification chaperone [Planctomycetota bacterium]
MTSDIFYTPDKLIFQARAGLHLVLDPLTPNWFSTNSVGSLIIRRLDGRQTLDEVASEIARVWHVSKERAVDDVHDFIRQGLSQRFIARTPFLDPPYLGRDLLSCPPRLDDIWLFVTNRSMPGNALSTFKDPLDRPPADLSRRSIDHLIASAVELSARCATVTGGEPFLHPEILSVLSDLASVLDVTVITDGAFLTPETVSLLAGLKDPDRLALEVNLDGPDAFVHDALRGPSFEKTVAGIRRAVGSGLKVSVLTTVTNANVRVLPDIAHVAGSLGARSQLLRVHESDSDRSLVALPDEVATAFERLLSSPAHPDLRIANLDALQFRVSRGRGVKADLCTGGVNLLSVRFDGHVFPCPLLVTEDRFFCGRIPEKSLKEIWSESPVLREFRTNSVQFRQGCSSCPLKFICSGGCTWRAFLSQRLLSGGLSLAGCDPFCCAFRGILTRLLWDEASRGLGVDLANEDVYRKPVIYNCMAAPVDGASSLGPFAVSPVSCARQDLGQP